MLLRSFIRTKRYNGTLVACESQLDRFSNHLECHFDGIKIDGTAESQHLGCGLQAER